jgi:hypothetical protein
MRAFAGNTTYIIGKCTTIYKDLNNKIIYSKHPFPRIFIITPKIRTISISFFMYPPEESNAYD